MKEEFDAIRLEIIGSSTELDDTNQTDFERSDRAYSVQPKVNARCYSIALSNQDSPHIAGPAPAIRASTTSEPDQSLILRQRMIQVRKNSLYIIMMLICML